MEFVLYVAPALLGADTAPLLHVSGLGPAGSLPAFEFKDVRQIGADLRLCSGAHESLIFSGMDYAFTGIIVASENA